MIFIRAAVWLFLCCYVIGYSQGNVFLAGISVTQSCFGSNMSTVTWLKNGSPVVIDGRVKIINSENSSSLTINPLHTSDGGQYECVVFTEESGSTETFFYDLKVKSKMK